MNTRYGGDGGIRTLELVSELHDFQSCALDRTRRHLLILYICAASDKKSEHLVLYYMPNVKSSVFSKRKKKSCKKYLTDAVCYDIIVTPLKGSFFFVRNRCRCSKPYVLSVPQLLRSVLFVSRTEGGVYFYRVGFPAKI